MSDIIQELLAQTRSDDEMSLKTAHCLRDAADEIDRLRASVEGAHTLLREMLIDPIATLDEPDADGEVILKYRRRVEAYLAAVPSTEGK